MEYRIDKDTLGEVKVPANRLWGAQTERSRNNFKIGSPASMPLEIIYGFAYLKKGAAYANHELGVLSIDKRDLIAQVCDEILEGKLDNEFPLVIWQTGSGTQSNMNVNEVIANRAHQLVGNKIGEGEKTLQPNDDVNKSQSSNDTFPTGMHIACYKKVVEVTLPGLKQLQKSLDAKAKEMENVVKIGRTHLMDATPLTLGQEFSGYAAQLEYGIKAIENTLPHLAELALGGTAVGTGLDRKSTRLNSSHVRISYAVFCLKKKIRSSKVRCREGEDLLPEYRRLSVLASPFQQSGRLEQHTSELPSRTPLVFRHLLPHINII